MPKERLMFSCWLTGAQDLCALFGEVATFSREVIKQLDYVLCLESDVHPQY